MAGRPKGKFTKTLGVDTPHPFAKKKEKKKPGRKPIQGPPRAVGRPPKKERMIKKEDAPKRKIVLPKKIKLPSSSKEDGVIQIQEKLLIKKSNGGTMDKQSQLGARLMHTIESIRRDTVLSKPQKREILKKGLKGIRKIKNMNMGGVMRGRGGTFKGVS